MPPGRRLLRRRGAAGISSDRDLWKLPVTTNVSLRKGHDAGYLNAGQALAAAPRRARASWR